MDIELENVINENKTPRDKLLDKWSDNLKIKRKLHLSDAKYYKKLNYIFGSITIIFSVFGSIFSTILSSDNEIISKKEAYLINTFNHFIILLLSGINQFYNFSNKEKIHLDTSHKCDMLLKNIEYVENLEPDNLNIKQILDEYNKITQSELD